MDQPTNPEILLLSSVIQTGDHTTVTSYGIEPDHFHSHRQEWEWLESFVMRYRKVPDKATFRSHFPDFPLLKTTDVEHACEAVEDAHVRYVLANTLREATSRLVDNSPHDALTLLHESMLGINRNGQALTDADALRDYNPIYLEAERRVRASSELGYAGVTLGFQTLNDRTGGLHPGDLAIWAARLGQGKTWMLCKVATEALLTGKVVDFVSLEQSRSQIVFRIHTLLARELGYSLRHRDLMQGINVDLDDYRSFLVALPDRLPESSQLYVSDPSRGKVNPFTLAGIIDRHDPDLMIVDYITLMQQDGDDWRATAQLSSDTKQVASQFGVPLLAAAQINREGDAGARPPSAKHLSQSDAIGQDADIIVTQRKPSESVVQCLLAKNRSGQDGMLFYSAFQPNEGRICEIPHDEALTLQSQDVIDED